MKELRVLVVDDEALARSRMRRLLEDVETNLAYGLRIAQVADVSSAVQAMSVMQRERFDVVLLDVHMPNVDGLQLAKGLRELARPPAIVFVTAHVEHALDAFELQALDYLTKPVRAERLAQALQRVRPAEPEPHVKPEAALVIHERGKTHRVLIADIVWVKAELKYLTVRTPDHEYIAEGSLGELEAQYADHFIRVHRSAIVARRALRSIERGQAVSDADGEGGESWVVKLAGASEPIAISRRQLASVRAALAA